MSPVRNVIRFTKTSFPSHFNLNFAKPFRLILLTVAIASVAAISLASIVQSSGFNWRAQLNTFKSESSFSRSNHAFVGMKESDGHVTVQAAGRGRAFLNLQDG